MRCRTRTHVNITAIYYSGAHPPPGCGPRLTGRFDMSLLFGKKQTVPAIAEVLEDGRAILGRNPQLIQKP